MQTIETNAKELTLTGKEIHVRFASGYPFFWLRNDGASTVLMSLSPDISEDGDGVISVHGGGSAGTMHGYRLKDLYIFGTGKVMVMGTGSAHTPFKSRTKGGDKNPSKNILPHSDGLTYFFDYQTNISSNGWWDTAYKNQIAVNMEYNDEYAMPAPKFTGDNFFLLFNW